MPPVGRLLIILGIVLIVLGVILSYSHFFLLAWPGFAGELYEAAQLDPENLAALTGIFAGHIVTSYGK